MGLYQFYHHGQLVGWPSWALAGLPIVGQPMHGHLAPSGSKLGSSGPTWAQRWQALPRPVGSAHSGPCWASWTGPSGHAVLVSPKKVPLVPKKSLRVGLMDLPVGMVAGGPRLKSVSIFRRFPPSILACM